MNKVDVLNDLLMYTGQKKEIKMKFEAKFYNKLFHFTKISKNSWRFAFPQVVAEELGVNENTHYLLFHSPERKIIALFLQSFSDMLRRMGFEVPEKQVERVKKREKMKEVQELTYILDAPGFFSQELRKVWVARTRKGNKTYTKYGAVVSHDVAQEMKISRDTKFLMFYSPLENIVTLELRNPDYIEKNKVELEQGVQEDISPYEIQWGTKQKESIWDEDVVEVRR